MKKERGVKVLPKKEEGKNVSKIFGIILIVIGIILLLISVIGIFSGLNSINTAFNVEGEKGALVPYLEYIQSQEVHALEKEQAMILYTQRMFDGIYFTTAVFFQLMFFSLVLIVLGITNIFVSKSKA